MKHKIEIRPTAATDIFQGFDWYENQKEGMGHEFLQALDAFFSELLANPFSYSYYDTPVRHSPIDHFPYTVYFEVFIESIVVYKVLVTKQELR